MTGDRTAESTSEMCRPWPAPSSGGLVSSAARRLSPERPAPLVDLYVATIDGGGRLPLRRAAATLGWTPPLRLGLSLHEEGVLHLSAERTHGAAAGLGLGLDGRHRVVLPHGVRVLVGFEPGVRVVVVTARPEGVVAALPLSQLIDALVRDR